MTGASRVPDYIAIGHLTIDRVSDGGLLGGSVLYASLAAARFGARAAVVTRGDLDLLDARQRAELDAISQEVEIAAQAGDAITTFTNRDIAGRREQTLHAWAGPLDLTGMPTNWRSAAAVHLAPVAQEIDVRQIGRLAPRLLGATPQGWMRSWAPDRLGTIHASSLRLPREVVSRLDALVLSSDEAVRARDAVEQVSRQGLVVVTRGAHGATVIDRGRRFDAPHYQLRPIDTTGAGDVFAGVLFAARALGESTMASLRYAAAAAALAVGGRGVLAVPARAAIEDLLASV